MKQYFAATIFILLAAGISHAQLTQFIGEKVPVPTALLAYSTLSEKELVIEPGTTNHVKTITMHFNATNALTKAEAAKVLEQDLRKQANIIITPIDAKHASVKLEKNKN
jgi:hypothetical protein